MPFSTPDSNYLFNACQLRPEASTRDNYAADLQRSLSEDSSTPGELSTPQSAQQFFESTYPTSGMKDICSAIFSRLTQGDASNQPSVYRLGSGFGGGKTHTLIALAGAAKHPQLVSENKTPVSPEYAPTEPVRLVTFTGENSDIERGAIIPGSKALRAKSLIGHIAWQVGGDEAFNQFRTYDQNLTSPGSEDIRRLLGSNPCLILVDELVQWLDRIQNSRLSQHIPNIRTLFSSLAQAVEACPNAVLVITTPDAASDSYRSTTQLSHDILNEVDSILARTARQTIPSDPPDLPAILRRRLFSHIDETARAEVSAAYASLCEHASALIAPPPQDRTTQQWFSDSYPLHPDTLRIILERIASNDNFQKTRGILRLLGMTTHHLRNSDHAKQTLLIHPHHIDPDNTDINAELTSRINRTEFAPAIIADITGSESAAARIDQTRPTRPARRIARTALLASLTPINSARGITTGELTRAVLTPFDDDPSVVSNAITEFRNSALYVNDDPGVSDIQFTIAPNLNRMLQERRSAITAPEINRRIKQAINECFTMPHQQSQKHLQATIFPDSNSNIPDNPSSISLGVINSEWLQQGHKDLHQAISNFYRNSPAGGGNTPRQFKNNLLILVADNSSANTDLEHHARRSLAAQYIRNNLFDTLQEHQQANLKTEIANSQKDLSVAIQKLYVNLYYPTTDNPISPDILMQHVRISPENAAEKPGDGQHAILHTLTTSGRLLTEDTANLDPESYWKQRPNLMRGKVKLSQIKEEFARSPNNRMLLNSAVADALIRNALDGGALIIQTGSGQVISHGSEFINTNDSEAHIYLRTNACPDCLLDKDDCACNDQPEPTPPQLAIIHDVHPDHPDQPLPTPAPDDIPAFESGIELQPLNVLAADLRRHMEAHDITTAQINSITLYSDNADFITYILDLAGQNINASVSYELSRPDYITITITNIPAAEWTSTMRQIAPRLESIILERIENANVMQACVIIHGDGNTPQQLDTIISHLPPTHTAGMEVVFNPKPEA